MHFIKSHRWETRRFPLQFQVRKLMKALQRINMSWNDINEFMTHFQVVCLFSRKNHLPHQNVYYRQQHSNSMYASTSGGDGAVMSQTWLWCCPIWILRTFFSMVSVHAVFLLMPLDESHSNSDCTLYRTLTVQMGLTQNYSHIDVWNCVPLFGFVNHRRFAKRLHVRGEI